VNSQHATLAHIPLVFLKQDIGFAQYLALLTVADTLVITSLREGMNLTSHEFVFCQDGKYTENQHGALILSEFTGSASVFGGSELPVNPYDAKACAEAIRQALEMTPEERTRRWKGLYKVVTHHTAAYWFNTFIERLSLVYDEQHARDTDCPQSRWWRNTADPPDDSSSSITRARWPRGAHPPASS
jgi:trehalose 6-phosphate synthase/phosphatase